MEVGAMLVELQEKAKRDETLRLKLIETKKADDPLSAFCQACRDLGYPLYEMDLIVAGEESYAAMSRSTNGGGENHPMLDGEDDYYELFFACLEN